MSTFPGFQPGRFGIDSPYAQICYMYAAVTLSMLSSKHEIEEAWAEIY